MPTTFIANTLAAVALIGLVCFGVGCDARSKDTAETTASVNGSAVTPFRIPRLDDTLPLDFHGLHNVVAYHDGFYSGSVPEGSEGFDSLVALGVKTIISVDGAIPELEPAQSRGMKYIHLPIGYNGFDETRKLQLSRATRDAMQQGPVYMHCHHGKHRSAGAAGTVVATLGWNTPENMVERMKVSGTAPTYTGLYGCTIAAVAMSAAVIDAVSSEFPEVSKPNDFVQGMIEIDEVYEHLRLIEKSNWRVPANHPDLVPVAEAGRLADLFRVLLPTDFVRSHPADFAALMEESQQDASALEDLLANPSFDTAAATALLSYLTATCKGCHVSYRDQIPRGEHSVLSAFDDSTDH